MEIKETLLGSSVVFFALFQALWAYSVNAQIVIDSKNLSPDEIIENSVLVEYDTRPWQTGQSKGSEPERKTFSKIDTPGLGLGSGFSVPCVLPVFMRLSRLPPVKVL